MFPGRIFSPAGDTVVRKILGGITLPLNRSHITGPDPRFLENPLVDRDRCSAVKQKVNELVRRVTTPFRKLVNDLRCRVRSVINHMRNTIQTCPNVNLEQKLTRLQQVVRRVSDRTHPE